MPAVKGRRTYSSELRKDQARLTRRRILEAAERLFTRDGYPATTIERVATAAGVATDTVYAIFRSKRSVLAGLMELRVGGDDRPIPMLERPEAQAMRREPNQRRQLAMFVMGVTEAIERARPIDDMMRSAAAVDPEMAGLRSKIQDERFRNMVTIVQWVKARGRLRGNQTVEEAAGIVWTLTSPELNRLLRVERGWSPTRYQHWLADTLTRTLL